MISVRLLFLFMESTTFILFLSFTELTTFIFFVVITFGERNIIIFFSDNIVTFITYIFFCNYFCLTLCCKQYILNIHLIKQNVKVT